MRLVDVRATHAVPSRCVGVGAIKIRSTITGVVGTISESNKEDAERFIDRYENSSVLLWVSKKPGKRSENIQSSPRS